jgi:hypothetical protein
MKIPAISLAAVVTATVLALPAATAWAETKRFDDGPHPTKSSTDVKWVEVTNDHAGDQFATKVRVDAIQLGSTLVVYVDRNLQNPGPELRMVAAPDSEWALFRVNTWGQRGREIDTCGRVRMSSFDHTHRATWKAERSCLGIHGHVRVAVKMVDAEGRADWAPKRRTLFPPVAGTV